MAGFLTRALSRLRLAAAGRQPEDRPGRRRFLALTALAPFFAAAPVLAAADPQPGHGGHGKPAGAGAMSGGPGSPGGPSSHAGHGGQIYPWRNPAIAITPPPPLTGKGDGVVMTPPAPNLGYERDGAVKVFRLTAQPVERLLLNGPPPPGSVWDRWHQGAMPGMDLPKKVKLWGFNGSVPGPTIEVVQGDTVRIIVKNELPEPTSIHWHGLEVPNDQDGVGGLTQPPIKPGATYVYEFTVHQIGTFMYHSSYNEKKQVGMGLGGFFIIHPADGTRRVDRDYALMLQEWYLLPGNDHVDVTSTDPNWFTINGKAAPSTATLTAAVGQTVRLRLANLSNMHAHPIHLHGVTWRVTGTEGGPIPESAQWPGNTVNVSPGCVRDVEFTFTHPGWWHMHCHKLHHVVNAHASVPMGIMPMGGMTMLFEVAPAAGGQAPGHDGHGSAPDPHAGQGQGQPAAPDPHAGHGAVAPLPADRGQPRPDAPHKGHNPGAPSAPPHAGHGQTGGN